MSTRAERSRRAALENGLATIAAHETRVLADLRSAGWRFRSIRSARQHLSTLQAIDRFNADENSDALAEELHDMRRTG